ncbi:unnamed protein product [Microthlaspi erraticum]|uniref:Ubiquitin carboxyl-terminal hydrolase n=1 Tax=Microthlaspi erraticum TaxID=1685480 RepID=A0A6D2K9G7_9BRAS|nr:unnamed protein product [Microthlaspi erraticum]
MEAVASSPEFRIQTDQDPPSSNGSFALSSSSASAVFRKIEFHPARKPFNGISNRGSNFKIETLNPSSATNKRAFSSAPSGKKPDGSDSAEHGIDPELTFTITFRRIGAGLQNLGNTCFLNSVLQCLTYTEPLAAQLIKVGHKNCRVAGFCALCAMQNHVRIAHNANGKVLAPKALVSNLRCVSRNFRNCRQEDAHEYMINLLECMHKCCLPSGVPSESSDAYRSSLVHKIFGGSLRSRVECAQCSHCSDKFDPFLDLSLDISKADTLEKALKRFTTFELLDDGAKVYQCEKCKQKVKAIKQLTIFKAPPYVLTIHLKRFEAHRSVKINKKVPFPSALDMRPFVTGPYEGNLKYTLYGVLVHYGQSSHSGHYACFVRTSNGMWHSLDDKTVRQVSENTVFNQNAYMLFYVRDRQNATPKNAVTVVKKETAKDSVATNRNDKVDSSTDVKACSVDALVANGRPPLRSCGQGAPAVSTQKDLNAKEIQKGPSSGMDAKEILPRGNGTSLLRPCDQGAPSVLTQKDENAKETHEDSLKEIVTGDNGTTPLRSCALGAPAGLTQRDLNAKETLQKEMPLSQAKEEESLGKANTQILVNLPTSGASAEDSVEKKNSVDNLDEPANSLEAKNVSIGHSSIQEAVVVNQTLGHHSEESDTLTESIKATSDEETLTPPRKTRKRNMKKLSVGLNYFKRTLGVLKKKKQKRGRSGTSAVKIISEELSTSQITREVASGSGCSHGKDSSKRIRSSSNGNMLPSQTGELKERTNQNGAVLASDQQQPSSDLSEASQNAKRKRESSKEEQISSQEEQETILTRGLPETVVAKWGEQVSSSKIRKSESTRIGYVADEWDEEYDRGKTKKIRIKEEMHGGPNPFQVIASRRQTNKGLNTATQRTNSAKKGLKKKWTQRMNTAKKGLRR